MFPPQAEALLLHACGVHPSCVHACLAGAADNLKKFKLPQGDFLHNFLQQQRVSRAAGMCIGLCESRKLLSSAPPSIVSQAIVNCMAVNQDGVLASGAWKQHSALKTSWARCLSLVPCPLAFHVFAGADNGSLWFWDWTSGNSFQQQDTIVQPGSLESEAGGLRRRTNTLCGQVCAGWLPPDFEAWY